MERNGRPRWTPLCNHDVSVALEYYRAMQVWLLQPRSGGRVCEGSAWAGGRLPVVHGGVVGERRIGFPGWTGGVVSGSCSGGVGGAGVDVGRGVAGGTLGACAESPVCGAEGAVVSDGAVDGAGGVEASPGAGRDGDRDAGDVTPGCVSEKTLANRAKRAKYKARKQRAQAAAQPTCESPVDLEWRRKEGVPVARGYFADLDESVQRELKETRARLLIEKNKRELVQEQAKLRQLASPMAAVEEAMKAMRVVAEIAAKANDEPILAWAKSVSESHARSISGVKDFCVRTLSTETTQPTGKTSVSAGSSASQLGVKAEQQFGLKKMRANGPESFLLGAGLITPAELAIARFRVKRQLRASDLNDKRSPYKLSLIDRQKVEWLESQDERNAGDGWYFN